MGPKGYDKPKTEQDVVRAWAEYVKAQTPQPMDVYDPLDTFMGIPIERNSACPVGQLFLIDKNQDPAV